MSLRSGVVWCVGAALAWIAAAAAHGQGIPAGMAFLGSATTAIPYARTSGLYASPVVTKFINSFASYQFPDTDTGIDPLSRLEFPIDQWFVGIKAVQSVGGVSVNLEILRNVTEKSSLQMQDSDWENPANPGQKTTFSESNSRLKEAWLVDFSADWRVVGPSLKPVFGARWQTFHFFGGDGFQNSFPIPAPTPLPGDAFDVRFTFKNLYLGGVANLELTPVRLGLQADYGWLIAYNVDRHLLRGDRMTAEKADGWCLHLAGSMAVSLSNLCSVWIQGDFKRMRSQSGSHQWFDDDSVLRQTWDGAKMWSDQQSVSAGCEFLF